jgi:hypothetical protein
VTDAPIDGPLTPADLDRILAELRTMPRGDVWVSIRDGLIRQLVAEYRRVLTDGDLAARLAAAEAEVRRLRAERYSWQLAASMACENPPDGCTCPGCSLADERGGDR